MRICIVVDNLNQATGWGRLAKKLGDNFSARGVEVGFITQTDAINKEPTLHTRLRNFSWKRPFEIFRTAWNIRQFSRAYDTVLCFDANPYGVIMAFSLFGSGVPTVLYCLGTYSLLTDNFIRNVCIRFAYAHADKVFVVSEFVKKQIEKSGLLLPHTFIIPVGVDPNFFYSVGVRPMVHGKYILGVGAIKHRKGFHVSIEAFNLVASEFPEMQYVIAGPSDHDVYAQSLEQRIKDLHLENRVLVLEQVSDDELRSLYSFAEFFLLTPVTEPNAIEGFGMVYLEAACCGIPAVGTIGTGAQEAIIHGETGLLADPAPEAIADAIRHMLSDNNLRKKFANAAHVRSKSFNWEAITDQLLKFLS